MTDRAGQADSTDMLVHKLWHPLSPAGENPASGPAAAIAGRIRLLSRTCACLAIAVGSLVILGWLLDVDALKNPLPHGPAIKANCALSMILLGSALLLFLRQSKSCQNIARILAFAATAIGLFTAFEYMTGRDFGIDQFLFADSDTPANLLPPGRIAPNTALTIFLCGLGLLTIDLRGKYSQHTCQICAIAAIIICLLGSLGNLYGVPVLCKVGIWAEMKLATACVLAILSIGIFFARPHKALSGIITSPHVGGVMARRILPAVITIPLLLGWLRLVGYKAGFLDVSFGTALLVVVITTLFAGIVLTIATTLNSSDQARSLSEQALRDSQRRLHESEEKYRLLWETSPDAVILLDKNTIVRFANQSVLSVLGHVPSELIGQSFSLLEPVEAAGTLEREISHYLETGEHKLNWRNTELSGLHKSGRIIPLEAAFAEVVIGDEHFFAGFMRDISERKEIDRVKNEFVSVISHELRTPLTSIFGSLSLMEGGMTGDLGEEALEMVQIARASASRLILLINDILDLNKIEAGKFELSLNDEDAQELVMATLRDIQGMADQWSVKLTSTGKAQGPIKADANRIVQVLTNLVSNAIKFSEPGSTVKVVLSGTASHVRFAVVDQGKGISPENVKKLFKKFQQLDSSDTRQRGGTGLGLAICKSIVEMHGGTIGVDTRLNEGSTFWFELPAQAAESAESAGQTPEADPPEKQNQAAPARILLVASDSELTGALSTLLTEEGYDVRHATAAAAAQQLTAEFSPDLTIMDLHTPGASEMGLVNHLRLNTGQAMAPVLALIGKEQDCGAAGKLQCIEWLTAPCAQEQILEAVQRAGSVLSTPTVLIVDDDSSFRKVVASQLKRLGIECIEAANGAEALQMVRRERLDLMVLDINMPRPNGFEVVDVLRQESAFALPLIVYSGRDLSAKEKESLTLGITRHLTKGRFSHDELLEAVKDLLQTRASEIKLAC